MFGIFYFSTIREDGKPKTTQISTKKKTTPVWVIYLFKPPTPSSFPNYNDDNKKLNQYYVNKNTPHPSSMAVFSFDIICSLVSYAGSLR